MDFKQFMEYMKGKVEERTKQEVKLEQTVKNNGKIWYGLMIKDKGINMFPVIYLKPYYEMYQQGKQLENILEEIINAYREIPKQSIDMSFYMNFESIKEKIVYRVINAEANKRFLETVPHEKILDLAKIYYVIVDGEILENASITINNHHMKSWGAAEEDIRQAAEKNTEKLLAAQITNIKDILKRMKPDKYSEEEIETLFDDVEVDMYVLANHVKIYGASAIFYKNTLKHFADSIESDLYIIPSSIHEGATRFAA